MAFIASVIYGISLGSLTVIPYSLILSYIPKDKEGSIVGINTLVVSASQVIAYLTSGVLIDILGYRANFLQGLLSTIFVYWFLERSQIHQNYLNLLFMVAEYFSNISSGYGFLF